jgi:hypothetical protein
VAGALRKTRRDPCGQLGLFVQPQLRVNSSQMDADRVKADTQPPRNRLALVPGGDENRDLELARRQHVNQILSRCGGRCFAEHGVALTAKRKRAENAARIGSFVPDRDDDAFHAVEPEARQLMTWCGLHAVVES